MRDGMKSNPEESLLRALAEFAGETGLGAASDRVRMTLRREVRARAYRRWAVRGLASALATAAALAAIFFGIATRSGRPSAHSPVQQIARGNHAPAAATALPPVTVAAAEPAREPATGVRPAGTGRHARSMAASLPLSKRRGKDTRQADPAGEWRKGEVVLSPWYFNTALPPAARSVLVRSEVDAPTAMRFGVASAGDTAPVEILFGEDGLPRAMRFVRRLPTQKN